VSALGQTQTSRRDARALQGTMMSGANVRQGYDAQPLPNEVDFAVPASIARRLSPIEIMR
jgi:hypothetical protein